MNNRPDPKKRYEAAIYTGSDWRLASFEHPKQAQVWLDLQFERKPAGQSATQRAWLVRDLEQGGKVVLSDGNMIQAT